MLCVTRTPFVALLATDTAADTFTDLYRFSSLQDKVILPGLSTCSMLPHVPLCAKDPWFLKFDEEWEKSFYSDMG